MNELQYLWDFDLTDERNIGETTGCQATVLELEMFLNASHKFNYLSFPHLLLAGPN